MLIFGYLHLIYFFNFLDDEFLGIEIQVFYGDKKRKKEALIMIFYIDMRCFSNSLLTNNLGLSWEAKN